METIARFFVASGFAPHGYCLQWSPGLIWTYVVADAMSRFNSIVPNSAHVDEYLASDLLLLTSSA
ncbi:hypothetical protein [Burkholderia cepacia]|uniref:hypothetical protein n=1 Tax=Burkholderia cepacia TaxID=292 RepID=UPI000A4A9384|nr:hypothetical protein [Burkholderia cepacia]